jgi:hypothetical protein
LKLGTPSRGCSPSGKWFCRASASSSSLRNGNAGERRGAERAIREKEEVTRRKYEQERAVSMCFSLIKGRRADRWGDD